MKSKLSQQKKQAKEIANLLKTIANPIRLMILCQIFEEPKNVSEILKSVSISQSALSQHLAILKANKIIEDKKDGAYVFYKIRDKKIKKIFSYLRQIC